MSSGFKYVPDDEETIEDEAPLATTDGEPMWTAKPATIELQIRICILLCCVLFALAVLISVTWRQYGGLIMMSRSSANSQPTAGVSDSPETNALRGAIKKHR